MRFLRIGITVCIVVGNIAFASPAPANALQSGIVIAQVQAGGIEDVTQEFVSLYNNSEDTITMTDWCLVNKSDTRFACIDGEIQLESFSYFTLGSASFADASYYQPDVIFDVTNMSSGSIVASSDTISLVASGANDIDSVGWTSSLSAGSVISCHPG